MDKCKYRLELGGKIYKFGSDKELTEFIKYNNIGKAKQIKLALDLNERESKVYSTIDTTVSNSDYNSSSNLSASKFLEKKHDIGEGLEYLAPKVDLAEYIKNSLAQVEKDLQRELTEDERIRFMEEKKKEIEEDDKMKNAGIEIHNIVIKAVEMGTVFNAAVSPLIVEFIDTIEKSNIKIAEKEGVEFVPYTKDIKKVIAASIKKQIEFFITDVNHIGKGILTRPNLVNDIGKVKDRPDVVVVDHRGNPHVLDVSLSRKPMKDWDPAKILNQYYKLGIQRQLLESLTITDRTTLSAAVFVLPMDGKLHNIQNFNYTGKTQVDTIEALDYTKGYITKNLKKLMPTPFTTLHLRDSKVNDNVKKLLNAIFPDSYEIKSKRELTNKKSLIKKVLNSKTPGGTFTLYDFIENDTIKITEESKIEEIVDAYIEKINNNKDNEVYKLQTAIELSIKSGEDIVFKTGKDVVVNKLFEKYLDGQWDLVDNTVYFSQGLFVFRNNTHNVVDVIDITANELNNVHDLGYGQSILGKFKNANEANKDSRILPAKTVNIEMIKTLAVLNSTPELFDGYTLGNIKVLNYFENKSDTHDVEEIIYNFGELFKVANRTGQLGMTNQFNKEIKVEEPSQRWYKEIMLAMSRSEKNKIRNLGVNSPLKEDQENYDWFVKLKKDLEAIEPKLLDGPDQIPDFGKNSIYNIHYLLSLGVTYYADMKFSFDLDVPRYGISKGDAGHLLQTLLYGEASMFGKKRGNRIVGFLQGSEFTNPDAMVSKDSRNLHDLIAIVHDNIREAYQKVQNRLVKITDTYYKEIGRGRMGQFLVGLANPYHENLFETINGEIDQSYKFKNPHDMTSNLTDPERKYLKQMLWELYKFKSKKLSDEYIDMDFAKFEKSEKFAEYTSEKKYYLAPLTKRNDLTKFGNLTWDDFRKSVGNRIEDMIDFLDPREITSIQREQGRSVINAMNVMYNEFDMDPETREKLIAEYTTDYFEVNIDTIALKYAFASIRENMVNKVLPLINSATMVAKYYGYESGKTEETAQAIKDFNDQVRISIYGINPVKGEMEDPISIISGVQKLASIAYIVMRPVLFIKELLTGTIKNVSYAWSKVYGDDSFDMVHLAAAYDKVLFSRKQSLMDFNIVDNLNVLYGVANMDINAMVKRTKTDRFGAFKFFSEHLYWFNNAPDYVNRLTLLVAKMMKDGSYYAHTINSKGEFQYDPAQDERYKIYFERRDKHKFQFAKNDTEYNDQRSLYLKVLEGFNRERKLLGKTALVEKKDKITRAYNNIEKESIKVFADMAYGNYDHERSAKWKHAA